MIGYDSSLYTQRMSGQDDSLSVMLKGEKTTFLKSLSWCVGLTILGLAIGAKTNSNLKMFRCFYLILNPMVVDLLID